MVSHTNRLRIVGMAVAFTIAFGGSSRAQQGDGGNAPWPFTRVRGTAAEIRRLIQDAAALSPTARALIEEIQQSNAIVMVSYGQCAKGLIRSCVSGVEGDQTHRHIRILVDTRTTNFGLMATIAHELHHAVEIIREPGAVDRHTTMALYRRIGKGKCATGQSERCETEGALATEKAVLEELYRSLR